MNLEELKNRASEIKKELQPKVKDKVQKAGAAVSDFVDEHLKNKDDSVEPESKVVGEAEYVEAAVEEDSEKMKEAEEKGLFGKNKKKSSKKKAKSVKFRDAEEAGEDETAQEETIKQEVENPENTGEEDPAEPGETSDENKSEVERIEGEVVDTVKDKFNSFRQTVMPKVKDAASFVGEKVKDVAGEIGSKAREGIQNVGPKLKESAENVGPKIKETAQNVAPKVSNKVKAVGPKVKDGAKKTGETISFQGYRLRKTIGKKFKNSIKKKLGIIDEDDPGTPDGIKYYEVKKKRSSKFMRHLQTVTTHRHLVFKHCLKAGIPVQGLLHDLSKYSPSEFYYGVKFFSGDRSPNEGEREDHGYSYAWMHHKGRNKHHFEYWNDYNIEANKALPVKMPLKYVVEMFCDRVAASKVYLKDKYTNLSPYEYFDKGRSRRTIHKETSDFLEKLLKMLAQKGEDYTFMYIKWYMKHHKDY